MPSKPAKYRLQILLVLAMKTFGIKLSYADQSSQPAFKKRRCALCARDEDRKVARVCSLCSKPICPSHSRLRIVCDECHNA